MSQVHPRGLPPTRGLSEESDEAEDIFASNFSSASGKIKIAGNENHFEEQAAAAVAASEATRRGN